MKNIIFISVLASLTITSFSSCEDSIFDLEELTIEEEAGLLLMREEEKLARDVYLYMYDRYGNNIFDNIASAEQKHMDKILSLLEKYNLEDNASTVRGVFNNHELQSLYDDLIIQGDVSLAEALKVGATIEDVDIYDLDRLTLQTSNSNILSVYDKLNCGSRNHMRAFINNLENNGASYTIQYISQIDFDAILASSNESCGK